MENLAHTYTKCVACDMINLRYEQVMEHEYKKIRKEVERLYNENKIVDYKFYEKFGSTDYRHNIHIQPGLNHEGAIYIGWHHNSARPNPIMSYDLKIELNPSKVNYITNHDDGFKKSEFINDVEIFKILAPILDKKVVRIIEFDIAIDLPYKMESIISIPLQGRSMNLIQGTRYYGQKHKDMYLKIYDKAKERKEKTGQDVGGDLTRLEFSIRPANGNGLTFSALEKYLIDIDKYYLIALYTNTLADVNVRCQVYSIITGFIQFKEFNHRQKKKIVTTIENELIRLSINQIVSKYWVNILNPIAEWCFSSVNDTSLDDFMERLKFNENERLEFYLTEHKGEKNK